ncbi:MAG TPA: glycosyltransferase family 4 protein [Phycisphaerae bacterium]|nr:glycosyltransferase family 4 protein [Phycisphaerae bacterium]
MGSLTGLHVLIVPAWWPSPEQPMAGVFCTDYAAAFIEAGAKVGVVFPDLVSMRFLGEGAPIPLRPRVLTETTAGAAVVRVRGLHTALGQPWMQMHRYRRWLARGMEVYREMQGAPDILHAMCAIPPGWACSHLDDPLSKRVVVTEHTGPFSLALHPAAAERYVRAAMDQAAAVIAVSEHSRREIRAAGFHRPIGVIGNPVSAPFTTIPVSRDRRPGPFRAIFVGRIVYEKGVEELIEAAAMLGPGVNVEWHFVGDGPMAVEVENRLLAAAVGDHLLMHGRCDRATVARLMAESDFLVLPTHGETFGLVVAEALCTGLPVLTTRGTACGDHVGENDGVLVEMDEPPSLAAGVRRLIEKYDRFDRPAIAARARQRFSGEAVAMRYSEVFRSVMAGAQG